MALPTSGALSLNAIHVEAGGTTGTTCSLNDTDIRGLTPASGKTINSTQGTTVDFDDFYGASSVSALHSATLTVGEKNSGSPFFITHMGFNSVNNMYGTVIGTYGSLSDVQSSTGFVNNNEIFSVNAITNLSYFYFNIDNASAVTNSNSGAFTTMTVNSVALNRSSAIFLTNTSIGYQRWWWLSQSNPLPSAGSTCTVEWT
tara:strand:+ start:4869 stop:5471 length:603 start_codon:yes stop_codon:yes gene_type:complete